MKLKNYLSILFLICFGFCCNGLFAQQEAPSDEPAPDIEKLEKYADSDSEIDKELQKNFIIVEPIRSHELNPQITSYSSDSQLLSGLYEGLFSYNPVTLQPQFAIASDYKIARDKKRMTFTIRENARYSNGEKITAMSVRNSWLQLLATPGAPYASLFDIIRGAEAFRNGTGSVNDVGIYAVDENTLSVYLTTPANYLPKVLCHSAFSVIHRNPNVFSGAFVLYDITENSLILKKNENYWDAKNTHLEQITFMQSPDPEESAFLYNNGEADWGCGDMTPEKILNKAAIQMNAEFATAYYFFKTSAAKPADEYGVKKLSIWDYPEFRNAVLEAMPWQELRGGSFLAAKTFVYPLTGYPAVEGFDYTDKIEALNKMKDARKKYDIPENQKLKLTFELTEYVLGEEKIQLLKDSLEPLGVELVIKEVPAQTYLSGVRSSDSDLFAYTWIGDFADPLAFLELFHGSSTLNDSGWKNSRYDELLETAATVSEEERYKLLAQAETILLDEGMIIPLFHPFSYNVINLQEVGGWANNAFDIHPLKYLYKKTPAIKKSDNVVKFNQ